jgi:hypothetical protein
MSHHVTDTQSSLSGFHNQPGLPLRSVTKVANLEGPEEELVAEDSPIRDCPHG